jgi:hypothetical protein
LTMATVTARAMVLVSAPIAATAIRSEGGIRP